MTCYALPLNNPTIYSLVVGFDADTGTLCIEVSRTDSINTIRAIDRELQDVSPDSPTCQYLLTAREQYEAAVYKVMKFTDWESFVRQLAEFGVRQEGEVLTCLKAEFNAFMMTTQSPIR